MHPMDKLVKDIEEFAEKHSKKSKKDKPRSGALFVPDRKGGFPTSPGLEPDEDDTLTGDPM